MAIINIDSSIKNAIAQHGKFKIALSLLFSLLSYGKLHGYFFKADGVKVE